MATLSPAEKKAFLERLDRICANLMRLSGARTRSGLGHWLFKSASRPAEMYFIRAKSACFLNYEVVINRCVEEGFDLNEVFGNGKKCRDYVSLLEKYRELESKAEEMVKQNGGLVDENRKIGADFRKLSESMQNLTVKYLELVNQPKS